MWVERLRVHEIGEERLIVIRVLYRAPLIDGTAPAGSDAACCRRERITAAGPRLAVTWPAEPAIVDGAGPDYHSGLIDARSPRSHG